MSEDIAPRLERYLADKLGMRDMTVSGLARIHGGASRETYRFRASYTDKGGKVERALILRRDPPASLLETDRTTEYRAYAAFHGLGLPVPAPIALELGTEALERPFFIMEEITDCSVGSLLNPDPYGADREKIGQQFWTVLGRIAAADPDAIGLGDFEGARDPAATWRHEVARWEKVIEEDEREPQPIARAAIRWLKRNPPPPAQKIVVVHGDYRHGNFLFDAQGEIRAILDWEMAHLGDPLEDLAWALNPIFGDETRPAKLVSREDAIAIWEKASGLKADPAALSWWEVFSSLKGLAIWISAACEYAEGRNTDAVNAFSGWFCTAFHNKLLAERLGGA